VRDEAAGCLVLDVVKREKIKMDCNEADLPVVCELTNKSSWAEARDARAEKIRKVLA